MHAGRGRGWIRYRTRDPEGFSSITKVRFERDLKGKTKKRGRKKRKKISE